LEIRARPAFQAIDAAPGAVVAGAALLLASPLDVWVLAEDACAAGTLCLKTPDSYAHQPLAATATTAIELITSPVRDDR
jgi:hypothetical protein